MMKKTKSGRGGPPNPVDIHVGSRIKLQRRLLGLTQEQFAKSLGVTFQQIQKYETGKNRISCSRLFDISLVSGVSLMFFFEEMNVETLKKSPAHIAHGKEAEKFYKSNDIMSKDQTVKLVRNFYRIKDKQMQGIIFDLCERMSKELVGRKEGKRSC